MLIDTHAHLNFGAFAKDLEVVVGQAQEAGVGKIINVGADLDSSQKAVAIAQKYKSCFASVGIHPHHARNHGNMANSVETLKKLAKNPKVVAIGECGLDYHPYKNGGVADPKKQKELFLAQIKLAQKLNLPIIFHCRNAHTDILEVIYQYINKLIKIRGVFHCFSGDKEFLEKVLDSGFYVGFDGNITYKNAQGLRDLVKTTPLNRLLLETDCPYLPPEPFRGLRNTPANVKIIARAVAQIHKVSFAFVANQTTQNATTLFTL